MHVVMRSTQQGVTVASVEQSVDSRWIQRLTAVNSEIQWSAVVTSVVNSGQQYSPGQERRPGLALEEEEEEKQAVYYTRAASQTTSTH